MIDKSSVIKIIRQEVIRTLLGQKRFIIAANWKMHKNTREATQFLNSLGKAAVSDKNTVVICPPFPYLYLMRDLLRYSRVLYGAQNVFWEKSGAYTGEVSPDMAVDFGCRYVIVGHSERRRIFSETDEMIAKKAEACLAKGLKPILCVGENSSDRNSGQYKAKLEEQLVQGLSRVTEDKIDNVIIAYEPVWAIGTGVNATPQQVEDTHGYIRSVLNSRFKAQHSSEIPILYGGSVKASNVLDIALAENVSGFLIGGASLMLEEFTQITRLLEGK